MNRICSECGKPMDSGFCIDDGLEYYCSDECLKEHYDEQTYIDMYESGDAYWTEWEEDEETLPDEEDRFFFTPHAVQWIYFNPDSVMGGQYVCNEIKRHDIHTAEKECASYGAADKFDMIGGICYQELCDVGTPDFDFTKKFVEETDPDAISLTEETYQKIKAYLEGDEKNGKDC